MLGEKILNLRKKKGLSQEQLGEKIGVTRQTISNWELNETNPNPKQLKQLSKTLNISIDELLDNNVKSILVEKVSNTEKLAGIIIKILKLLGLFLITILIINIIAFILFGMTNNTESSAATTCKIEDKSYQIEVSTNKHFKCDNCSEKMNSELKKLIDFNQMDKSIHNIENYFKSKNGFCE